MLCYSDATHVGNLNDNTLEEVFNSDLMKKIRVDMMNNVKSESCERCWKQEENGAHSMRMRANESWKHHVEDSMSRTNPDGSVEDMKLPYWDFRFSNICNFKCRSCLVLSSGWYSDSKKIALKETGRLICQMMFLKHNTMICGNRLNRTLNMLKKYILLVANL